MLVYLLELTPIVSTAYSLFVVGTTSLVGSLNYMRQQQVNYKAAILFSVPSFVAVYLTRHYLIPAIPDPVFSTASFVLSKRVAIMLFFALVMLVTSVSMIRDKQMPDQSSANTFRFNLSMIALDGILVGLLTGIVGAGGGFLIIPALVLLVRLPMKMAVGTSLLIIAANTLIGFWGSTADLPVDWPFPLKFTSLSVVGILLGTYLSRFIPGQKLKKALG